MASILDTLLAHLDACNTAQVEAAAQASRVPYHTVAKIKRRETLNPRIATVQRLLTYFDEARRTRKSARKAKPTPEAAHR
jgi:predicted transcriptional regulator